MEKHKSSEGLGLLDTLPLLMLSVSGSENLLLIIAGFSLVLTSLIINLKMARWFLPVTIITYIITGVIGIFYIGNMSAVEMMAEIIVFSRAMFFIDGCFEKMLLEEN